MLWIQVGVARLASKPHNVSLDWMGWSHGSHPAVTTVSTLCSPHVGQFYLFPVGGVGEVKWARTVDIQIQHQQHHHPHRYRAGGNRRTGNQNARSCRRDPRIRAGRCKGERCGLWIGLRSIQLQNYTIGNLGFNFGPGLKLKLSDIRFSRPTCERPDRKSTRLNSSHWE